MDVLPPIGAAALKAAAASFPAATALGADNISPRALLRLPTRFFELLSQLLARFEKASSWPLAFGPVITALLPKADGGLRPIGLFPSILRVWSRARAHLARQWESAHALPQVFSGPGMGGQRATWLASFHAENARRAGQQHAAALIDITKAYGHVQRRSVAVEARRWGYSATLLRASLGLYRLPRVVSIAGALSRPIIATRGIAAGAVMASTEL